MKEFELEIVEPGAMPKSHAGGRSQSSKKRIDLDGNKWLQHSLSIWSDIRKSREELALDHPAIFPCMLAERLITVYSHKGDTILDPFAGTGSTLLAAKSQKRHSIGIELSNSFISVFKKRLGSLKLFDDQDYEPQMIHDDALNISNHVKPASIQLSVTSPPYWDILNQRRTADYKESQNYGDLDRDLGNVKSYSKFLQELTKIFDCVYRVTKPQGFCCVVLMDLRKKNKLYPFHVDTISFMQEIGFELDDIVIWDRRQEYNNLRPLGYPYVFRINKVHEYILIFKK